MDDPEFGSIYYNYESYKQALEARELFVKGNTNEISNVLYIEHGFPQIITGHGVIGLEIYKQLSSLQQSKLKNITFLASCGAGGPIGIGIALKFKLNCNFCNRPN